MGRFGHWAVLSLVGLLPPAAPPNNPKFEQTIITATNAFRKAHALKPLSIDPKLAAAAQKHARNMARQDKYGDDDQNGHVLDQKGPEDRIRAESYPFAMIGENVGYNQGAPDPPALQMQGWKDSKPHRENLLNPDFTEIGIGAAQGASGRWYFCQDFGRPARLMVRAEVQVENQTSEAVTVRLYGDGSEYTLKPGATGIFTVANAAQPPRLAVLPRAAKPEGAAKAKAPEPAAITLKDGGQYVIVDPEKDGRYRVQPKKE